MSHNHGKKRKNKGTKKINIYFDGGISIDWEFQPRSPSRKAVVVLLTTLLPSASLFLLDLHPLVITVIG
ncbi:MAG TPA: hypothetical protein VN888_27060 [Mycobacterium sp.]|nr:hypothetical protein [Mycobacterium sp.]